MQEKKISVVLCDDSEIIRAGIIGALERHGTFNILGTAADGLAAISEVVEHSPDVVLMDISMPRMDGIEATRQIKNLRPATRVLMLTGSADEKTVDAAFSSGANGYCLKQSSLPNIIQAIHATACGATWLDQGVSWRALLRSVTLPEKVLPNVRNLESASCSRLSGRECEVLNLLVQGDSNKKIATSLMISTETVKTHVRHIMEKMQVGGRTQLVVKAIRNSTK